MGFVNFFSLSFLIYLFLWETARYRLKYCLNVSLSPNQPTNHELSFLDAHLLLFWFIHDIDMLRREADKIKKKW